ncbi:lysyl-tRNA synthetase [Saccharata proteae CBS 121410]|uniref:Lysyl-tRNA synthetase n=1 Tax=Saccharata proteae CBS 121410 TaxID=1314787 RepID=A0A9P4LZE8_9PEZI|nr:lysyl-tRNA synthetase [Saccharata proteae CBS 121410]
MTPGRVTSRRTAGSMLLFVDFQDRGDSIQGFCNFRILEEQKVDRDEFKKFAKCVRKGDIIRITGHPCRSSSGELSVMATQLPEFMAPCLHQIPEELRKDSDILAKRPHVDFLRDDRRLAILHIRARIIDEMRQFFSHHGFLEVNTPVLAAGAGGAVARPFETRATEFPDEPLNLRIAPELLLKRLVIGTGERVYEIGTVFRNEGIDATHNPEFQICEFYQPHATLGDLMKTTEKLFEGFSNAITGLAMHVPAVSKIVSKAPLITPGPFKQLEFIPTIEKAINRKLPPLHEPAATIAMTELCNELGITLPSNPTLPRILDHLAGLYIEPLCIDPTFITHHPNVMSPLAKCYMDHRIRQVVSLRAELFIKGREYVNAYEEENSPFEQRRNFEVQLAHKGTGDESMGGDGARGGVDESYIEALEWGLPPTGGWGCGIDRLVMLYSGSERIADVQPFGTLRNVVAMSKVGTNKWMRPLSASKS